MVAAAKLQSTAMSANSLGTKQPIVPKGLPGDDEQSCPLGPILVRTAMFPIIAYTHSVPIGIRNFHECRGEPL